MNLGSETRTFLSGESEPWTDLFRKARLFRCNICMLYILWSSQCQHSNHQNALQGYKDRFKFWSSKWHCSGRATALTWSLTFWTVPSWSCWGRLQRFNFENFYRTGLWFFSLKLPGSLFLFRRSCWEKCWGPMRTTWLKAWMTRGQGQHEEWTAVKLVYSLMLVKEKNNYSIRPGK